MVVLNNQLFLEPAIERNHLLKFGNRNQKIQTGVYMNNEPGWILNAFEYKNSLQ